MQLGLNVLAILSRLVHVMDVFGDGRTFHSTRMKMMMMMRKRMCIVEVGGMAKGAPSVIGLSVQIVCGQRIKASELISGCVNSGLSFVCIEWNLIEQPTGNCRCAKSNFGVRYCTMTTSFLHGHGQKRYTGDRHPEISASGYPDTAFEAEARKCRNCGRVKRCLKKEHLTDYAPEARFKELKEEKVRSEIDAL